MVAAMATSCPQEMLRPSLKASLGRKERAGKRAEDADDAGGNGGDGGWLGDDEPGPGVEESGERAVGVAHVDVFAAGLGLHGAEFGITECAEEGEQAADDPSGVDELGGADGLHHLGGNEEDAAADDGADDYGGGVADFEVTGEFASGSGHDWRLDIIGKDWKLALVVILGICASGNPGVVEQSRDEDIEQRRARRARRWLNWCIRSGRRKWNLRRRMLS